MRHGGAEGIPASRCSNGGGGTRGCGDIFFLPLEQRRPEYCDSSNTGDIYGGRMAARSEGVTSVVRYRGGEDGRSVNIGGEEVRCGNGGGGEDEGGGKRGDTIRVNKTDRVT